MYNKKINNIIIASMFWTFAFFSAAIGVIDYNDPNTVADPNYTLFLAHYDGTTTHEGKDADFSVGDYQIYSNGGVIYNASAKFGGGSVDVSGCDPNNFLNYSVRGNYDPKVGTVEMWIKPFEWKTYFQSAYIGFFSMWSNDPENYACDIRLIRYTQYLTFYAWQDGLNSEQWYLSTGMENPLTGLGDGQWHHIAWTWDANEWLEGGYGTSCIFIDGQLLAGPIPMGDVIWDGTDPTTFDVGSHQNGWGAFPGLIDEFRISSIDRYKNYRETGFLPQSQPWPSLPPVCGDSQHPYPKGDYNQNCVVDFIDYSILAVDWLNPYTLEDMNDLSFGWLDDTRP